MPEPVVGSRHPGRSRVINQTVVGVRYQGTFGGLGVLAYAACEHSGNANYTGLTTAAAACGTATGGEVPGSTFNGIQGLASAVVVLR